VSFVKPGGWAYIFDMAGAKKKGKTGRPKVFPDSQLYSLRLPQELHRQLQAYAKKDGRSMNVILLKVIQDWWESLPAKEPS
jgi:predicted HicB family RNase H-like nuclease